MKDLVLDVGNCGYDHRTIQSTLSQWFDVEFAQTDQLQDTLAFLANRMPQLILINRKLDIDHSDGIEILKALKANPAYSSIPMMLVTNYDDHQQLAVQAGALYGFGKQTVKDPHTKERLLPILGHACVKNA